MSTTIIAKHAAEARDALAALAQAVRGLPPPGFKLARSIQLLDQLASWANPSREHAVFQDAATLSTALAGGLEVGCDGRKAAPARRGKAPKETKLPVVGTTKEPTPTTLTEIAQRLGRAGGRSRSDKKVAASRANMEAINELKWGKRRRRRAAR